MKKRLVSLLVSSAILSLGMSESVMAKSEVEVPKFELPPLNRTVKGIIIESKEKANESIEKSSSISGQSSRLKHLTANPAGTDWFNLNPAIDAVEGASIKLAYGNQYPVHNKNDVIVAVIDTGVDITHEDLQGKIWVNEDEIPGNGIDDDGNGYIDDIHGWNFIGGKDGQEVGLDTLEVTREYTRLTQLLKDGVLFTEEEQTYFERVKAEFEPSHDQAGYFYHFSLDSLESSLRDKALLTERLGISDFSMASLTSIDSDDPEVITAVDSLISILNIFGSFDVIPFVVQYFDKQYNYYYNTQFDTRSSIVKDDPDNLYEHDYGNNNVMPYVSSHGTHVAGIIAADRSNELGIQGVASNVKIMALRAVPDGDERDKDIANAVRYAVDNGAKIINMSFGKGFSPNKPLLDEAFSYAAKQGVLLIHSAGNDGQNNDIAENFPNPYPTHKPNKAIPGWLEVGASSYQYGENLSARFSNYGKQKVDLFAPGHQILSSVAGNRYASYSGTSMASPVVSGVAAMLLSRNSHLKGKHLKQILMESAKTYPGLLVNQPGSGEMVLFSELSKSGGVVDADKALMSFED